MARDTPVKLYLPGVGLLFIIKYRVPRQCFIPSYVEDGNSSIHIPISEPDPSVLTQV